MRIRRVLFLLAAAEVAGCRSPAPRPTAPALASSASDQPVDLATLPAGASWLVTATQVRLANGRLLLLGGGTDRAAVWDGVDLVEVASMPEARDGATATLLLDGSVLVVGGTGAEPSRGVAPVLATTLRWTVGGGFVAGPAMATPRVAHTATLLSDGSVLVIGGQDMADGMSMLDSLERLDVAAGAWRPAGTLAVARHSHTATLMADGRVVVIGGREGDLGTTGVVEIWNDRTQAVVAGGALQHSRIGHQVHVLSATEVEVSGGTSYTPADEEPPMPTELMPSDTERVVLP